MKKKTTITTEKHEVWIIRNEISESVLQGTDGVSNSDHSLVVYDESKSDEQQLNEAD